MPGKYTEKFVPAVSDTVTVLGLGTFSDSLSLMNLFES